MKRALFSAFLVLSAAGPVAAAPPLRQIVEEAIAGYEPRPKEALQRLDPQQATEALIALAGDPAVSPLRRLRAVEALGYVPTPVGLAYLRQVVTQRQAERAADAAGVYELAAAARALGGFGEAAAADAARLLGHGSADVREGAVYALTRPGLKASPIATAALRRQLAVEKESGVRAALSAAISAKRPVKP